MSTPSKKVLVEDPLDGRFDPSLLPISSLLRLLSKFDVDLPPSKAKKQVYIDSVLDHLPYIQSRAKQEAQLLTLELKKQEKRKSLHEEKELKAICKTPSTEKKKEKKKVAVGAAVEPDNQPTTRPTTPTIFSSENSFQSPKPAKLSASVTVSRTIATPVISSTPTVEINFASTESPPIFVASAITSEPSSSTSRRRKSGTKKTLFVIPDDDEVTTVHRLDENMTSEEPLDASREKPTLDRPIATPTKIMDSKYTLQERLLKRNQSKKSSLALSTFEWGSFCGRIDGHLDCALCYFRLPTPRILQ